MLKLQVVKRIMQLKFQPSFNDKYKFSILNIRTVLHTSLTEFDGYKWHTEKVYTDNSLTFFFIIKVY